MNNFNRRKFVKTSAIAFVAPAALASGAGKVFAQDAPMVDESSAQAKALQYVAVSTKDGQTCGNCALYQGADKEAGPCPLFTGSSVAKAGWCSAWVVKP
ncbi:MAG: high-potential iron-sulfur protein [Gammaproteobacteria bacterium]|nr:high-potential iron-sulfur protein [Gammaproteobacteria bacterium]